jgi:hypothetical protein
MRCFEVFERVRPGISVIRDGGEPRIAVPSGCGIDVRLHPRIIAVINSLQSKEAALFVGDHHERQVSILLAANNLMILQPYTGQQDHLALVHVCTAGGVGGKAYLTANVLEEDEDQTGRVFKRPSTFPPRGVQHYVTEKELAQVRTGIEMLDILLMMRPGSNFCVRRTGDLEGAQSVLSIRWSGFLMQIDGPKPSNTRYTGGAAGLAGDECA